MSGEGDAASLLAAYKQQQKIDKAGRLRLDSINEPSSATPGSMSSCTSNDSRELIIVDVVILALCKLFLFSRIEKKEEKISSHEKNSNLFHTLQNTKLQNCKKNSLAKNHEKTSS